VKGLKVRNLEIQSNQRALIFNDVHEVDLQSVTLSDREDGSPLVINGGYSGAVYLGDYPVDQVTIGTGVPKDVILTKSFEQAW
jgi:hypothetical protein